MASAPVPARPIALEETQQYTGPAPSSQDNGIYDIYSRFTESANSSSFTVPVRTSPMRRSLEVLHFSSKNPSPAKDNPLSLALFEDASTDGFTGTDQNDEIACKNRYSYFEVKQLVVVVIVSKPSVDNIIYEQTEDSHHASIPGANGRKDPPIRTALSFRDFF